MRRKFDFTVLLVSLAVGLIWAVAGNALYQLLLGKIWAPLLIGILFLGLAGFTFLGIWIADSVRNGTEYTELFSLKTVLVVTGIFVLAVLFEFIYEVQPGFNLLSKPTGYAFVIDDSSSMAENDQENQRTSSIEKVMLGCDEDFPYVVYRFSAVCERITDQLTAKNAPGMEYPFRNYGVTDVRNALELAADEIADNTVDLGNLPRILLFSDGVADDEGIDDMIEKLNEDSITVCAVACGDADMEYLKKIAEGTGGTAVNAEDIDDLTAALSEAATVRKEVGRNLLSTRRKEKKDWIYTVLRILFLLLLLLAFVLLKALGFYTKDRNNVFFWLLILLGAVAILNMEFGSRFLQDYGFVHRGVLFAAFALLLGAQTAGGYEQQAGAPGGAMYGGYDPGMGNRACGAAGAGSFGDPWGSSSNPWGSQPDPFSSVSGGSFGGNMQPGGGWAAAGTQPKKHSDISFARVLAVIAGISLILVVVLLILLGLPEGKKTSAGKSSPVEQDGYTVYASRHAQPQEIRNGELIEAPVGDCTCGFYGEVVAPQNDYYICLTGSIPGNNISFYIEGGKETTLMIPKDTYKISYYKGTTWYGKGTKFGDETVHEEIDELCRYSYDGEEHGYQFAVTNGNLTSTGLNADS